MWTRRICFKHWRSSKSHRLPAWIRIKIKIKKSGKVCFQGLRMVKQELEQAVSHHGD